MLVFLDTEFTTLARVDPDLISIGLAAVDASDFYAERLDYRRDDTSAFVRADVIPMLGKMPGAACTSVELASRLRGWFCDFLKLLRRFGNYCDTGFSEDM